MPLDILVIDQKDDARAKELGRLFMANDCAVWVHASQTYKYPDESRPSRPPKQVDLVLIHHRTIEIATWTGLGRTARVTVYYTGGVPDGSTEDTLWIQHAVEAGSVLDDGVRDIVGWINSGCHIALVPEILGGASEERAVLELLSTLQAFVWLAELHGKDAATRLLSERAGATPVIGRIVIANVVARELADPSVPQPEVSGEYVRTRLDAILRKKSAAAAASPKEGVRVPVSLTDLVSTFRDVEIPNDWITHLAILRDVMLARE